VNNTTISSSRGIRQWCNHFPVLTFTQNIINLLQYNNAVSRFLELKKNYVMDYDKIATATFL